MTVRSSTFYIILIVSLLPLFTTKTEAHNRVSFPSLCLSHPSLLKCALDIESALKNVASTKTHIEANALTIVLDSINATKAAGISILHFLSSNPKIELSQKLNKTIDIAVYEIIKASTIVRGETKITPAELHNVEKSLKIASKITAQLNVGVGLKHANSDTNALLCTLIKQFNNLINLAFKVVEQLKLMRNFPSKEIYHTKAGMRLFTSPIC